MNTRSDVIELLRNFDPADSATTALSPRAEQDLEEILLRGPETESVRSPVGGSRDRAKGSRVRGRWLVGAAAIGAGVVALTLQDPGPTAYASWTAYPTGVTASVEGPAVAACQQFWGVDADTSGTGTPMRDLQFQPVMAETRGDYSLVLAEGVDGFGSVCHSRSAQSSAGGEPTGGYSVWQQPPGEVIDDEIELTMYDAYSDDPDSSDMVVVTSILTGRVGSDVAAVVIHPPEHQAVQASVLDGRFAAWWPWEMADDGDPYPDLSFDIEMSDGSIVEDVSMSEVDVLWSDQRD